MVLVGCFTKVKAPLPPNRHFCHIDMRNLLQFKPTKIDQIGADDIPDTTLARLTQLIRLWSESRVG